MIKNIFKKALILLFTAALALSFSADTLAVSQGFANFTYSEIYTEGQFGDVSPDSWFGTYVKNAVNFGLIRGRSENTFDPSGLLTRGEAATLASRLRSIFYTGVADFAQSVPFYMVYAEYALAHGLIYYHGDYTVPVTRSEFAEIMHRALPSHAFAEINDIPAFGIIDVSYNTPTGKAAYALYRAGILTGSDRFGSFFGSSNISRAEAAAIMIRFADPSTRVSMQLPAEIPVEELFHRSANAVFMIETFDGQSRSIRTGSGFFISPEGLAVTGQHVLDGASTASITLFNGEVYNVSGILAIDRILNIAIMEIDFEKTGLNYLTLANSDLIEVGNSVFAIGSPRNMINSISEGIVAYTTREFDVEPMIQFTAPISFGSGGGPLLNALGQVIGIASSSFTYGQNLNLAIPVNLIAELELGELIAIEDYWQSHFE